MGVHLTEATSHQIQRGAMVGVYLVDPKRVNLIIQVKILKNEFYK